MTEPRRMNAREVAAAKSSIKPVKGETAAQRLQRLAESEDLEDFFSATRVYEEGRTTPEYVARLERELDRERGLKRIDRRLRRPRSPQVAEALSSTSKPESDAYKGHRGARVLLELPEGELTDAWDLYVAKRGMSGRRTLQELVLAELKREANREARARRAVRKASDSK